MIYIVTIILLLLFIFLYDYGGMTTNKKRCYEIMLLLFVCIAGFRYRLGVDTVEYERMFYEDIPLLIELQWSDLLIEPLTDPGFLLSMSIIKTLFGYWEIAQFAIALFVNIIVFRFFWRNSTYPFIALLLYFLSSYYTMNYDILRQSIAIAFFLLAYEQLQENRYIKYYMLVFFAMTFHRVAFLLLLLPFARFLKFNTFTFGVCVMLLLFVNVLNNYFVRLSELFSWLTLDGVSDKIITYSESEKWGGLRERSIVNFINIFIANLLPSFFLGKVLYDVDRNFYVRNQYLLLIYLLSRVLMVAVPIFYRIADLFQLFYLLFFSRAFIILCDRKILLTQTIFLKKLMIGFCCLMFVFSFYSLFFKKNQEQMAPHIALVYPYANVFTKEISPIREMEYSRSNRDL